VRFWDSSALVPLLVLEATTAELTELYPVAEVVAWWTTEIECASAVTRLERSGSLGPAETTEALGRLRDLAASWHQVEPTETVREIARRLLRVHDLRAADSLQLGAAIVASERRPASLEFVCRDRRLALAAEREGFPIL